MAKVELARGDVVVVDLVGAIGTEKKKERPCLVVQNDMGNKVSPMTIVVPLTDASARRGLPTHVEVSAAELGAGGKNSIVACEQIRTIDRDHRIDPTKGVLAHLSDETMAKVDAALRASLGLGLPASTGDAETR